MITSSSSVPINRENRIISIKYNTNIFSNLQPSSLQRVWPSGWSWLVREPRRPSCWPLRLWWVAQCWQRRPWGQGLWWCHPCQHQWCQRLPWTPGSAFGWRVWRCWNQTSSPSLILFQALKQFMKTWIISGQILPFWLICERVSQGLSKINESCSGSRGTRTDLGIWIRKLLVSSGDGDWAHCQQRCKGSTHLLKAPFWFPCQSILVIKKGLLNFTRSYKIFILLQ